MKATITDTVFKDIEDLLFSVKFIAVISVAIHISHRMKSATHHLGWDGEEMVGYLV